MQEIPEGGDVEQQIHVSEEGRFGTMEKIPESGDVEQQRHVREGQQGGERMVFNQFGVKLPQKYIRQGLAEAFATFGVVFISSAALAISRDDPSILPRVAASLISGLAAAVEAYTFGHISGSHVNPFVTLSFAIFLDFQWERVPYYLVGQMFGVVAASLMLRATLYNLKDFGTTTPIRPTSQAFIVEVVFSMLVMLTKTAMSSDPRSIKEFGGIAVGFIIAIGSFLAGPISGGSMNPYRSLGSAIATNKYDQIWIYFVAHFISSVFATFGYSYLFEPLSQSHAQIGVLGGILVSHGCGFGPS